MALLTKAENLQQSLRAPIHTGLLQRKHEPGKDAWQVAIPPIVHEVLSSSGQPLDPSTRAFMEPRFGHDFSQVRVHVDPQAHASAQAVEALAYTTGHNIVFGAGQYRPETNAGRKLLAHELAHVVQQRQPTQVQVPQLTLNPPVNAQEREANQAATAISSGNRAQPIQTGSVSGSIQRQPAPSGGTQAQAAAGAFDAEDAASRARRLAAIQALRNAMTRLNNSLSGGYLWPFETATANGINVSPFAGQTNMETTASRAARLKRLLLDLNTIVRRLESAPIPGAWLAPNAIFPGKGNFGAVGPQAWQDAQMFYAHRSAGLGMSMDLVSINIFYLETDPIPTRMVRPTTYATGVELGIYIVVPDENNEPLVYHRLDQYGGWNSGEAISVWKDQIGYYYIGKKGARHYLPGRP